MSDADYPLPGFNFSVRVLEKPGTQVLHRDSDASFQEISGIETEFKGEPLLEGDENRFVHRIPKQPAHQNLVLKRGVAAKNSALLDWVAGAVESDLASALTVHDLVVTLSDEHGRSLMTWTFADAYPVKFSASALAAQDDKILIEVMEFAYTSFKRDVPAAE